jgi:uncharacterized protein (TIGR03083 family)
MISVLPLFSELDALLLDVLRRLQRAEWQRPTLAPLWQVRDVAAHLLDGNLRGISLLRDGHLGDPPDTDLTTYEALVAYLNRLNADWVQAMRRVSPAELIRLLEESNPVYRAALEQLDPQARAVFGVAWAGEQISTNWFHIAREYTEKWHHQQQIRQAVGQEEALMAPHLYQPFLQTSLRALPHHYRRLTPPPGTSVVFHIGALAQGLVYAQEGWHLEPAREVATTQVFIPEKIAWRIFTKGISRAEAEVHVRLEGAPVWGLPVLDMLAVMA